MTTQEPKTEAQVGIGTHVVIEMRSTDGTDEQMAFFIVPEVAADYDAGYMGADTPLAKALLGKYAGATVPYVMGDIESIRVIEITRPSKQAPADGASRRQSAYEEALRKAERTNAEMFASSYGSKWGSYDLGEED